MENPLERFVNSQGRIILDGGLATALEAKGYDLNDPLWSAKILLEEPEAIRALHRTYLEAGADCISTATYQASLPGFSDRGLSEREGTELMRLAIDLATEARDSFWARERNRQGRLKPLVAASIGPYGAYLADGSEYRGDYGISVRQLHHFHLSRWQVLNDCETDLLACETIPSVGETEALLQLLGETVGSQAWISFSCRDGKHICDGTPLREVVRACDAEPSVVAIGINCTAPEHVISLIAEARAGSEKMILVYPNLGEHYDPVTRTWGPGPSADNWLDDADEWAKAGAAGIGGCCRIGPEIVRRLRERLTVRNVSPLPDHR